MNVRITCSGINIYPTAADLVWSPIFQKFKNVKVALAEGGIGWIPYFLERADYTYEHHKAWTLPDLGGKLPSEVFRERIITCFIVDKFGMGNLGRHERGHGGVGVRLPALRHHMAPLSRSGVGQRRRTSATRRSTRSRMPTPCGSSPSTPSPRDHAS